MNAKDRRQENKIFFEEFGCERPLCSFMFFLSVMKVAEFWTCLDRLPG